MTMTQGNDLETAVPDYELWCKKCFQAGIDRLCKGFVIRHNNPAFPARKVAALDEASARVVRARAAVILIQREGAKSETTRHPNHAGTR